MGSNICVGRISRYLEKKEFCGGNDKLTKIVKLKRQPGNICHSLKEIGDKIGPVGTYFNKRSGEDKYGHSKPITTVGRVCI